MSNSSNLCTHSQVYELATDIASEFENVVDICGIESLNPIVLKVIRVLEYLEASILNLEALKQDVVDLKHQNLQLQIKRNVSETERIELEQDLEELQESADKESEKFKLVILKLREENKHLHASLQEHVSSQTDTDTVPEQCLVSSLTNNVLLLNTKLEEKDSKLLELTHNISKLQLAVEELTAANKALCRKVREAQEKIQSFHNDKSDLKEQISEQKEMLKFLTQCLNEETQQKLDLEESQNQSSTSSLTVEDVSSLRTSEELGEQLYQEREMLLVKIFKLQEELSHAKTESESYKNQYMELQMLHSQEKSTKKSSNIRQLFHFFLGLVVVPTPENFRCF